MASGVVSASVTGLAARLRSSGTTATELVARALDAARNSATGAFVELLPERAAQDAAVADRELAGGTDRGPLHGIPVAVKDNIDVAGAWTRCGTRDLGHHCAERDAAIVSRLRDAGAVVIGKTRTHELAWGMVTPGCRNPLDPARITGGSSGGSAAAVAEGVVPVALGTDTGGSIRNPAALCGVVGIKAGVGTLPTDGVAPLAPTQDAPGVLGATVSDCRVALTVLGAEPSGPPVRRVGVIRDHWARRVEPPVAAAIDDAVLRLREAGVEAVEVAVRNSDLAMAASYVIMLAESARHWWPADPDQVGPQVRDVLRLGARVADADYRRALAVRRSIIAGLDDAFGQVDALLMASSPVLASRIGDELTGCAGRMLPVQAAHASATSLASVSGVPALSVPGLPGPEGLPTGVQFLAPTTDPLLRCAELLERGRGDAENG
ncbi:aspartyl-tRNA(Asn)/glutamyl-tRNA(Gln) amidotransferase subunit A [Saccharopolyspora erythraea NRRL 2338]|nr:aspartyl-tRNA(Asn)/glutamyl-tRNA(Gln) amidotransferase subunit A [Saccharopolyspora erythraea NRRL 2338]